MQKHNPLIINVSFLKQSKTETKRNKKKQKDLSVAKAPTQMKRNHVVGKYDMQKMIKCQRVFKSL
jgi:hypothetical protein